MIKSEFTPVETLKKELEFPVLAQSYGLGVVRRLVLFTKPRVGVCLWIENSLDCGDYCESWIPVTDKSHWQILPKGFQVTLTQE